MKEIFKNKRKEDEEMALDADGLVENKIKDPNARARIVELEKRIIELERLGKRVEILEGIIADMPLSRDIKTTRRM